MERVYIQESSFRVERIYKLTQIEKITNLKTILTMVITTTRKSRIVFKAVNR